MIGQLKIVMNQQNVESMSLIYNQLIIIDNYWLNKQPQLIFALLK